MKKDELKTSKLEDLTKALEEAEKEMLNLRIQNSQGKLKNNKSLNFKRKEIARIATFIRQKEITNAG